MRPDLASEIDIVFPLPPWWVTALIAAGCLAILSVSLFLARKRRS
jgi:hypothetical protein